MRLSMTTTANELAENLLLVVVALAAGIAAAAVAIFLGPVYVLAVACMAFGMVILMNPRALLWFTLFMGIVMTGVTQMYVPGSKYLKYVAPLMAGGLLLHVIGSWMRSPPREAPLTVPLFVAFLLLGLVSMAANWTGAGEAIMGFKNYYPMWALFLGLTVMSWKPETIDALPKVFLWVALLQLPFVIHQFFYLVPIRMRMNEPGMVAVDVVSGTFGGRITGGGANAVLAVFLISVAACIAGVWREGGVRAAVAVPAVLALLAPVFLNGSKVSILYIPLAFFIVFASDVARHPLRLLLGLAGTAAVVAGLVMTYAAMKPGAETWQEFFQGSIERQFESARERSSEYNALTRWTALTFWAGEHEVRDLGQVLIGHGPGATRVQDTGFDLATTLAETRYGGMQIGYTAVSALLWEVGVLGLLLTIALFVVGYRQAVIMYGLYAGRDPTRAGIARGLCATMVLLTISLAHKDFFVSHIPFQTLVVCALGYLGAQMNLSRPQDARGTGA